MKLSALRVRIACTKHCNYNIRERQPSTSPYLKGYCHFLCPYHNILTTLHLNKEQHSKLYYMSNYCERFEMHPKTLSSHYSNMTIASEKYFSSIFTTQKNIGDVTKYSSHLWMLMHMGSGGIRVPSKLALNEVHGELQGLDALSLEKHPPYILNMKLQEPQSQSGASKRKISCHTGNQTITPHLSSPQP
jgi:hypothetical protein